VFRREFQRRHDQFGLELHPDKTRLIRFGGYAAVDRRRLNEGKPERFDFLGFTHICGKTKSGRFLLLRQTSKRRMRAQLKSLREEITQRRHMSVRIQGRWLKRVVRGYFAYHAVPTNIPRLDGFRKELIVYWFRALRRRSQRTSLDWQRMK
jgi:hypothetical protein